MSTYNYAENEPVAHIDLWGLQKYYAASGGFISQDNDDNSIRIVPDGIVGAFKSLSSIEGGDAIKLKVSEQAYLATPENEEQLLREWANEYTPKTAGKEYAMSLFKQDLTDDNGETISVIMPGTTVENEKYDSGGASIDPSKSKAKIGGLELEGWARSSTIHTHPYGGALEFSGQEKVSGSGFMGGGGDVQWALKNNVRLYLSTRSDRYVGVFNPTIYNEKIVKSPSGYIYSSDHKKASQSAISRGFLKFNRP